MRTPAIIVLLTLSTPAFAGDEIPEDLEQVNQKGEIVKNVKTTQADDLGNCEKDPNTAACKALSQAKTELDAACTAATETGKYTEIGWCLENPDFTEFTYTEVVDPEVDTSGGTPWIPKRIQQSGTQGRAILSFEAGEDADGNMQYTNHQFLYTGMNRCAEPAEGFACLLDSDGNVTTTVVPLSCFQSLPHRSRRAATDTCPERTRISRDEGMVGLDLSHLRPYDEAWESKYAVADGDDDKDN